MRWINQNLLLQQLQSLGRTEQTPTQQMIKFKFLSRTHTQQEAQRISATHVEKVDIGLIAAMLKQTIFQNPCSTNNIKVPQKVLVAG